MRLAMIRLNEKFSEYHSEDLKILLQIHDELIFEIKNDSNYPKAINKITNLMSNAHLPVISFNIPIEVSVGQGSNWDEAH